jgi:hypothetical protein
MTETTPLRNIRLVGPRLAPGRLGGEFAWSASLGVVYSGAKGKARSLLSATFGLRVLLQDGEATKVRIDIPATIAHPLSAVRKTVDMRTPHLLAANAYPHDGASLGLGDFKQRYDLLPDKRQTGGVTTLVLTPLDPWPTPQRDREIEVPRFALAANRLPVLVSAKGGTAKKPAGFLRLVPIPGRNVVAAFVGSVSGGGPARSVELPLVEIPNDKGGPYVALDLTPDGIELRGTIANPARTFAGDAAERIAVVLRIACAAEALSPASPIWALELVREEGQPDQVRAMLAAVRAALGPITGNPLVLDIDTVRAVPAVRWPLTRIADSLALPTADDWLVRVDPAAVRATLVGSPIRQATLPTQAPIAADRLEIAGKGATARLTLVADRRPGPAAAPPLAGVRVTLRRDGPRVAATIVPASSGTLNWSLDAAALARDLVTRYTDAGVHPAGADETFAFLPIVGGWLQLPLASAPAEPATPPSASATPVTPAPFPAPIEFAMSEPPEPANVCAGRRLSVSAADRVEATAELRRTPGSAPVVDDLKIELTGAGGSVEGVLWAASGSPSAEAILPGIAAGPAAIVTHPLAFGTPAPPGALAFSSAGFAPGTPFTLTLPLRPGASSAYVWHGYDDLPLITAVAMTRTAEGSGLPSETRGLLCRMLARDSLMIALTYPAAHGVPALSAKPSENISLSPEQLPLAEGDEGPFAQVPLVPVTLPGIEFKPAPAVFATLRTRLRFDLPVLDELFATTRLPEKASAAAMLPASAPADAPTALDLPRLREAWRKAVDRLDLSRVVDAAAFDFGAQTQDVAITTLVRGATWHTRFSLDLDVDTGGTPRRLGAYTLGGERVSGDAALAGITRDLTLTEVDDTLPGPIHFVGFAAAFRKQAIDGAEMWRDTRAAFAAAMPRTVRFIAGGGLVYRETALWRDSRGAIDRLWHATLLQPIPIEAGAVAQGRTLSLWFRDLPLVRRDGGRDLLAVEDGPELALGPRQSAFEPETLPTSLHEWRLCNDRAGSTPAAAGGAYEIAIGPFVFRPLRLLALRLVGEDRALAPAAATILGTVSLNDGGGDAGTGPFAVDRAYATGNLVALAMPAHGGALSLATATWTAGHVADDESQPAVSTAGPATLSFRIDDARIMLGDTPSDGEQGANDTIALALTLAVGAGAATDGLPPLTAATLDTHLFGSRVRLQGGRPILSADRIAIIFAAPSPGDAVACGITVDTVTVTIRLGESGRECIVRLDGRLAITAAEADAADADAREIVAQQFGEPLRWLNQPIEDARIAIDHRRGVARWSAAIKADTLEPIAGLPAFAPSRAAVSLTLAFPRSTPQQSLPLRFHSSSGFGGFVVASGQGSLRRFDHAIVGTSPRWSSRIEVDMLIEARTSRIRWPIESVRGAMPPSGPVSGVAVRATLTPYDPAKALEHSVTLRIDAQPIATGLLGVGESPQRRIGFARPWLFHALADHTLSGRAPDGAESTALRWTSLDHVAVIAADSLSDGLDDQADVYAFAGRYRQVDSAEETAAAVKGGIVLRRFALAGLPPEQARWSATSEAALPFASLGAALLVTGAGPSIVETGTADGDPIGVPLALPWIVPLDLRLEAPTAGSATVQDVFYQAPLGSGAEWDVPDIDWAAGMPMPLARRPATAQAIGSGKAAEIAEALRRAMAGASIGNSDAQALAAVEQAFLRPLAPALVAERPIWLRSLLALCTVWDALGKASRSIDEKVVMVVPSGQSDGRVAALRLVPRRTPATDDLPVAWAGALVAIGSTGTGIDPAAGGGVTAAGRARLVARADQLVKDSVAILLVGADGRDDPIWQSIDPPRDREDTPLDIPIEQPLAGRLFASSALGWPTADGTRQAASGALGIGDDAPFQDSGQPVRNDGTGAGTGADTSARTGAGRFGSGLSGRSASLSLPARSVPHTGTAQAIFVALGRKMLFKRPVDAALPLVAPPARYLSAGEARVVLPLTAALDAALAKRVQGAAAPIVPPRLERIGFGLRPGALQAEFDMLLFAAGDGARAFDAEAVEFGRPGHAGPRVLRQIRTPRAPALPRIPITAATADLVCSHGRRTFVEIDDHDTPGLDDPANVAPTPFRLFRGAATLLRPGKQSLWVGITDPLPSDWDGRLTLRISAPSVPPPPVGAAPDPFRDRLVATGLLNAGLSAALSIDHVAAPFALARWRRLNTAIEVVLICTTPDALRDRLAAADGDTIATLILRCGPRSPDPSPPAAEFRLATEATETLRPAEQVMLSIRLPIRPYDRASLRVDTATLAFADPSYDRALSGPGASDTRRAEDGSLWRLALDRFEYGSDTPVQFAFGKIDSTTGSFPAPSPALTVPVTIQRQPSGVPQDSDSLPALLLGSALPSATQGQAYAFTLDQLRLAAGETGPIRFANGDQLILSITVQPDSGPPLTLSARANIVSTPVVAPPPAAYSLVAFAAGKARVPLHATAPAPQRIEYEQLTEDLARGHIRRRAIFLWPLPLAPDLTASDFSLVKIDRAGAGQLPSQEGDFRSMTTL